MKMKTILFLEGGIGNDHEEVFKILQHSGFEVSLLNGLHKCPENLEQLPELNPDCIFIGTTGIYAQENGVLEDKFLELGWIPKNVMFAGESSIMAFLHVARKLKPLGVKFWEAPNRIFRDDELEEVCWI